MARIGLLINPFSKRNARSPKLIDKIIETVGDQGRCMVSHSLEEAEQAILELADGDFDCLGIASGDGGMHHFISVLRRNGRELPPLLFVPSGTINMVRISLQTPRSPVRNVRYIVDHPLQSIRRKKRDLLNINDTHFGFVFGIGLAPRFLEAYYQSENRGARRTAELIAQIVVSAAKRSRFARDLVAAEPVEIILDSKKLPLDETTIILLQTFENLSSGFRPMYRAFEKEGTFHVIATDLSAGALVNRMPTIFRGRPWNNPRVIDELGKELRIIFPGDSAYQVDGDIYPCSGELVCKIDDKPVEFLIPA